MARVDRLRLVGFQGSSKLLEGELRRLVKRAFEPEQSASLLATPPRKFGLGSIGLPFAPELGALVVCYQRTAARALWDLYELHATRLEPLYRELLTAASEDERDFFGNNERVRFSVEAVGALPIEAGARQVVGTVKNALLELAQARGIDAVVDPDKPELVFQVRGLFPNEGAPSTTVSLDLSGRPLHERGYRTESGLAPLREDLAAALVMLCRFDPRREALFDPLAGTGTIAIEAALMAQGKPLWTSGRAPLVARHRLFESWVRRFQVPLFADTRPPIFTCERDRETFELEERALQTAGLEHTVMRENRDFRELDLERVRTRFEEHGANGGVILTNPPYGGRLEAPDTELSELYGALGSLGKRLPGFRTAVLIGEPEGVGRPRIHLLTDAFGRRPRIHKPMKNGPLRASFLLFD